MYRHVLKERGQIFEEGISLPLAAPHTCAGALKAGANPGLLSCTLTASSEVSIAAGKSLTISLRHGDSRDGPYRDLSSHSIAIAEALHVGPGGVVARILLPPDSKAWIRALLFCDDALAAGSVDLFVEYLAR